MDPSEITYLTFAAVLILAIIFDLGLLSKISTVVSTRQALYQTGFWVSLAVSFFIFLWYQDGNKAALEYLSAYLMEWSLSVDNIFVFILIFTFFAVAEKYYARVLFFGILLAILLRIGFISAGIVLVSRFHWILYFAGALLIYTGITMFFTKNERRDLAENPVYRFLGRILPLTSKDSGGKFSLKIDGKKYYSSIFVVVILLATTDILFALDSIPAVFGITQNKMVIYTSNIFAVLGLRSMFFLLHGAVGRFRYLGRGIAVVLIFVGLKMLAEIFDIILPSPVSLLVILVCLVTAILCSVLLKTKDRTGHEIQH
jgi:tellurite resistance protein TerC